MKLTWAVINERLNEIGWKLHTKHYEDIIGRFKAVCEHGHQIISYRYQINQLRSCPYCRGMKYTPHQVEHLCKQMGLSLKECIVHVDYNKNHYVPKNSYITVEDYQGTKDKISILTLEYAVKSKMKIDWSCIDYD